MARLNPYLNFRDSARQAMEFYHSVFGGELKVQTFEEFHASDDPAEKDKVMHAALVADGITLMASDTPNRMEFKPGNTMSLSLTGDNEGELRGYFDQLSAGGKITMPMEQAQWGDTFGMCTDQFGVQWMVNITAKKS